MNTGIRNVHSEYQSQSNSVIQFWCGDFSGRNVRDDVAETQMTKRRPSQEEQF